MPNPRPHYNYLSQISALDRKLASRMRIPYDNKLNNNLKMFCSAARLSIYLARKRHLAALHREREAERWLAAVEEGSLRRREFFLWQRNKREVLFAFLLNLVTVCASGPELPLWVSKR